MLYQRGKAYSQDLRERVFAASDDGERVGEVAELLRVSVSYVSQALTRRRTTGETTVRPGRGHNPPKLAPFYAAIRAHVAGRGDTTIEALRAWLSLLAAHQVSASVGLTGRCLSCLG
jgi:transposase